MDYLQRLVVACFLTSGSAHAAYAQLSPPAGWSGGSSGGQFTYGAAANSATISNGTVRTNAALNVAGRSVSMPASMRFSANAPRVIAAAIYLNPALRAAVGIASMLGVAKYVWDEAENSWREQGEKVSGGYWGSPQLPGRQYGSAGEACKGLHGNVSYISAVPVSDISANCVRTDLNQILSSVHRYSTGTPSCPAGWTSSPAGCLSPAVPQPKFVEDLAGTHIPDSVPSEIPGVPLPVELPEISPKFVPTGDPVRNPNYDPNAAPGPSNQPFIQPGTNVTPRPTPSNPWQVDIQPVERPQATPEPLPESEQNPETDPNDKPKEEDSKSLCEKHPDIVACQKLGDVTPENLAKNTVSLHINREEGFGPANGSCPAPKEFIVMGKSMAFRWDLLCDFATQIRPLLVGFAYLSAALAFFGLSRRD